jgi:glycerol-3-phosphate acyltransferase PlsY
MVVAPIISLSILKTTDILLPMIAISFIVIAKHRLNIERLIEGRESKLKF